VGPAVTGASWHGPRATATATIPRRGGRGRRLLRRWRHELALGIALIAASGAGAGVMRLRAPGAVRTLVDPSCARKLGRRWWRTPIEPPQPLRPRRGWRPLAVVAILAIVAAIAVTRVWAR